jgi:hypothetical protein
VSRVANNENLMLDDPALITRIASAKAMSYRAIPHA